METRYEEASKVTILAIFMERIFISDKNICRGNW